MRDQTDPQDASPKYPTLSQLSTEELRRLLVHEMDAPNGETPDTGLIAPSQGKLYVEISYSRIVTPLVN